MSKPSSHKISLLPVPRSLVEIGPWFAVGRFAPSADALAQAAADLLRSIVTGSGPTLPATIAIDPAISPQGYRLSTRPDEVRILSGDAVGAVYAVRTIAQLIVDGSMPAVDIEDSPDFPVRGVMLDISRDKVPTMATLFSLVDMLAGWKINQLQLYTEHTFAYVGHESVWQHASPMTAAEIRQLDEHCRSRFIELVPNQNSFGHMERWFKFPQYHPLAEAPEGSDTGWGFRWEGGFSLCPTRQSSLDFLSGLYDQLLPNFSSRLFNVGCDETFDIGQGGSKQACAQTSITVVYIGFLKQVNELVRARGRTMMFWGDVILQHPEQIDQLPKDAIALQWGYEAEHPFDRDGERLAKAGVPFYVCPGTSSWNCLTGRTMNAIANLRNAAAAGRKYNAAGYLITDWGDNGHLQYLPVSYLGFAVGAAVSWCGQTNASLNVVDALNHHAFNDPSGILGQVAYDLGNIYRLFEKGNSNGSLAFRLLVPSPADLHPEKQANLDELAAADRAIDAAIKDLPHAQPAGPAGRLLIEEFTNASQMLKHALNVGRHRLGVNVPIDSKTIATEHRRLWLARNRPGGLEQSVGRLEEPAVR